MATFLAYTDETGTTGWIAVEDISCILNGTKTNTTDIYLKSDPPGFLTAQGSPTDVINGTTKSL